MTQPRSARSPDLTHRQLNRATLDRQLLLARADTDVVDAVRRVLALQAQEPASPYLALWNRIADFDPSQLDAAFRERHIVKTPLIRITLHAIARTDYPLFHDAVSSILRAARLNDARFRETGLTVEDADSLVETLVEFATTPRAKDEIIAHLRSALGADPHEHVWWALRTYAPLIHSPTGSPWSFGRRPEFEAGPHHGRSPDDGVQTLIRRYLEAFGPATVQDIAQFTLLRIGTLRPAIAAMDGELVRYGHPAGGEALDVVGAAPIPDPDTPAPARLLGMWDSVLLAYRDRARVLPDGCRTAVIRRNGDVLPTVLVDGSVVGVWRPTDRGIEVTPFEPIADEDLAELDRESTALIEMIADRDPALYSRYGRWWDRLPTRDRFVIGASPG